MKEIEWHLGRGGFSRERGALPGLHGKTHPDNFGWETYGLMEDLPKQEK